MMTQAGVAGADRSSKGAASVHRRSWWLLLVAVLLAACSDGGDDGSDAADPDSAAPATVRIVGWQGQIGLWDQVLAVFEAEYPHIDVVYESIDPVAYDGELDQAIAAGTAADVIGCRGYDWALDRYESGQFRDLSDLEAMANFTPSVRATWTTDDGSISYCVPGIANMTGFFYNRSIFTQLGLTPPTTEAELYAVLDAIAADGRYVPLALGLESAWVGSGLGYENIGPPHWQGERGRLSIIAGTAAFTDPEFVAPFSQLARWSTYLPQGAATMPRLDGQALFMTGQAALMPAGSWEIEPANQTGLEIGAIPPMLPNPASSCHVNLHPDLGFALNAATTEPDAARVLLEWLGSAAFAEAYMNAFPGLFTLQRDAPTVTDPLAQEMLGWLDHCQPTPRLTGQILSRGDVNLELVLAETSIEVLAGVLTPDEAAARVQAANLSVSGG